MEIALVELLVICALFAGFMGFLYWRLLRTCCLSRKQLERWQPLDEVIKHSPLLTLKTLTVFYGNDKFDKEKVQLKNAASSIGNNRSTSPSKSQSADLPTSPSGSSLQHQSKSYPGGRPSLCRTPSVSSQTSMDSPSSVGSGHRGSSPQIRTYAPDGRTLDSIASAPRRSTSRSPSPLRAVSLDIRSSSPGGESLRSSTSSQANISYNCSSPNIPRSIASSNSTSRCLSPLMIPSRSNTPDFSSSPAPPSSPLGAIQPDLYTRREGPLFIHRLPEDGPDVGRLHFRLKYDFNTSDLIVHLIEAHDLPSIEVGGFCEPYVRAFITPEMDGRKRQSIKHKNTPNPYFDHQLKFPMTHDDLLNKTLILQVLDADKCARNEFIGEVKMCMNDFDVTSNLEVWGEFNRVEKTRDDEQAILISMSYLPSAERLTVVPMKARNLQQSKDKDTIDPFAKVHLLMNGKRVKKKKTAVKKCSEPIWNEAITFTLPAGCLPNAAVEVLVLDQSNDLIGSNPLLGSCTIGPKQYGPGRDHWQQITKSPRSTIACWHLLK